MTVALSKSLTPVSRLDGSDGIGRLLHDRREIYAQRQPRRQHVATIGVVNNHRPIQLTDRLAVAQSHPRFFARPTIPKFLAVNLGPDYCVRIDLVVQSSALPSFC